MSDVTKELLDALEELVAEFGVCGLTEKARAAIARAEAALAEPRPEANSAPIEAIRRILTEVMDEAARNGPAFPVPLNQGEPWSSMGPCDGMTLRQYAAIKLRVPNSGTDWLDEMIRTSLRDDLAAKAYSNRDSW